MPFAHLFHFGGAKRRDDDVHSSDKNGGARLRNQRGPAPKNKLSNHMFCPTVIQIGAATEECCPG
jgi:hypothetical protein